MIKGYATPEGTAAYKSRFKNILDEGHFRLKEGLWFSSIGIGSYLGDPDETTDSLYEEALTEAIASGMNVVDSAINYRFQRSERSFGKALGALLRQGTVKREEIILCTKGGFIPFDGSYPADPTGYFEKTYFDSGLLKPEDIAQECHALTPRYLAGQHAKLFYRKKIFLVLCDAETIPGRGAIQTDLPFRNFCFQPFESRSHPV